MTRAEEMRIQTVSAGFIDKRDLRKEGYLMYFTGLMLQTDYIRGNLMARF